MSDAPSIRRVVPEPAGPTTVAEAYDVARPAGTGRPWLNVCMVATLDGSVTVDGRSGGLGNENDRRVLSTLRSLADVVIVGATTAAGEGYGPPKRTGLRIGVVTTRGRVDPRSPLFTSGAGFVITCADADIPDGIDTLRAGDRAVDLVAAFARLDEVVPGVTHVQAEGGPTLNGALFDADLVDEICLTWSPTVVGGSGARLTRGAAERRRDFRPAHILVDDDGFVFTRWTRDVTGTTV